MKSILAQQCEQSASCEASGVCARIKAARIPLPQRPPKTLKRPDFLPMALEGGEDYELLFTVSPRKITLACHAEGNGASRSSCATP